MFHDNHHHAFGRRRHRDERGGPHGDMGHHGDIGHHGDMGHQLRAELRRNIRRGGGQHQMAFRELINQSRQGPGVRRGEVRPLILTVLAQRPMHGYEVIQELEAQSGGRWRPSAGSVYPTLQQLADEGLVTSEEVDGRRVYTLTDDGRKAATESGQRSPWGEPQDQGQPSIPELAMQLHAAVIQVHKVGSARAEREASRILTEARRQMYRLLSEDEDVSTDDASDATGTTGSEQATS